jgi:hypothetical protein
MRAGSSDYEGDSYAAPTPLPKFDTTIRKIVSNQLVSLLTGVSGVLVAVVLVVLLSTAGAPDSVGSSVSSKLAIPTGVQENIDLVDIMNIEGCWRVCHKSAFNDYTPSLDKLKSKCRGDWIFLGALPSALSDGDAFTIGAFGEKRVVFEQGITLAQEKSVTVKGMSNNGVYWYGTKENTDARTIPRSIGFSSAQRLELSAEDDTGFSTTCTDRLSFSFDNPNHEVKITGAADCKLFKTDESLGNQYYKVIMSNTCPVKP